MKLWRVRHWSFRNDRRAGPVWLAVEIEEPLKFYVVPVWCLVGSLVVLLSNAGYAARIAWYSFVIRHAGLVRLPDLAAPFRARDLFRFTWPPHEFRRRRESWEFRGNWSGLTRPFGTWLGWRREIQYLFGHGGVR